MRRGMAGAALRGDGGERVKCSLAGLDSGYADDRRAVTPRLSLLASPKVDRVGFEPTIHKTDWLPACRLFRYGASGPIALSSDLVPLISVSFHTAESGLSVARQRIVGWCVCAWTAVIAVEVSRYTPAPAV